MNAAGLSICILSTIRIDDLMLKVEQAYENVHGIPKNENSAAQWAVLKNPDQNLLGGFMSRWKREGRLGQAFIDGRCNWRKTKCRRPTSNSW